VDAQQIGGTDAVLVHVAHAISAAQNQIRHGAVGKTDPRREVIAVGANQGAVVDASVFGLEQAIGNGIVVGKLVVAFPTRGGVFVAYADVQGQLMVDAEIVLHVGEVLVLPVEADAIGGELIGAPQAEHEIGEGVAGGVDGCARGTA